ncbi:unnamed protein product, partial [Tetraodon nigroviridis]
ARGIHVQHVSPVIIYNLVTSQENYIHKTDKRKPNVLKEIQNIYDTEVETLPTKVASKIF